MKYPWTIAFILAGAWVALLGFIGPFLVSAESFLTVILAAVLGIGLLYTTGMFANRVLDARLAQLKAEGKALDKQLFDWATQHTASGCRGCVTCEAIDQHLAEQRGETEEPTITNTREA